MLRLEKTHIDLECSENFKAIYCCYVKKLCSIAFNQVKDKAVSEGIVQNVFCRLWERRTTINLSTPIENYLVRAVKLASMEYLRTKELHRKHIALAVLHVNNEINTTNETLQLQELHERIALLINKLPNQCRKVYQLSRESGMNTKEIATALLIAEKTVESHLTKALKFLRANLADYQKE